LTVKDFKKSDGMLSNFKILKSDKSGELGSYIFYVRNTTDVYRFNIESKEEELVGKSPDCIIAFQVGSKNIRQKDYEFLNQGVV